MYDSILFDLSNSVQLNLSTQIKITEAIRTTVPTFGLP